MAKTYEQIARQIETLKKQADALKRKESSGVIARIKEAISFYDLSAADLGLADGRSRSLSSGSADTAPSAEVKPTATATATAKRAGKRTGKRPSVVRFHDADGHTWTGMGRKPGWLVDGLASGKTLSDFAATPNADATPAG